MRMIETPNGIEYIYNDADVVEIIRTYISDDMADYVGARLGEAENVAEYERLQFESDYEALESEVDEYRDELWEIKSQLEQISYEAEGKSGLSKKKVLERIDKIANHLQIIL